MDLSIALALRSRPLVSSMEFVTLHEVCNRTTAIAYAVNHARVASKAQLLISLADTGMSTNDMSKDIAGLLLPIVEQLEVEHEKLELSVLHLGHQTYLGTVYCSSR